MERMKQLTVCIDDGLQGEVVYRAEISHTEEDYQELKSDLEFAREENKNLEEKLGEKIDTIQVLIREKYEEKGEKLELFKENKKLKEDCKVVGILNDEIRRVNENLREENKKLKEDVDYRHHRCMVAERGGEDED